ncbi:MAG TPA: MlaD family protein [Thermoleophilaceae bacterium]
MTRRLVSLALVAALVAGVLVSTAAGPGTSGYRVDAVFDNADFLIPGQDVKVGGARAGRVVGVHLTRDRHARIELSVDERFAPFRDDAECSIRPQSLIGEKFVQCNPGTADSRPLGRHGGDRATVPLARTHSPVDIDLVFSTLRRPLRERLTLIVNELGTGLAGRPQELNEAIRRANPALQATNRMFAILDGERQALGRLIVSTDRVADELVRRRREVRRFVENADGVLRTAASHRDDLDLTVRRLPPLLAELEPAATTLRDLSADARPLVGELRAAAPDVRALLGDLDPLTEATRPTLVRLAELSRSGLRAVRAAGPVARLLRPVADRLPPTVSLLDTLTDSIRDQSTAEHIARFLYYGAAGSARFDRYSHMIPSYQVTGKCQQWVEEPTPGCDAHFASYRGPRAAPDRAVARGRARRGESARARARGVRDATDDALLDWLLRP